MCVYNSPAANLVFVLVEVGPTDKLRVLFDVGEYVLNDAGVGSVLDMNMTEAFDIHTRGTLHSVY